MRTKTTSVRLPDSLLETAGDVLDLARQSEMADVLGLRSTAGVLRQSCALGLRQLRGMAVSDATIRQLRSEAVEAGDGPQVRLCDQALDGDAEARIECATAVLAARQEDDR
jgi:hypothetical protein